jgi:hypothetical protein
MHSVLAILKSSIVWGLFQYTESDAQRLFDHPILVMYVTFYHPILVMYVIFVDPMLVMYVTFDHPILVMYVNF